MPTFLLAGALSAVIVAFLTGDWRLLWAAAFLAVLGVILRVLTLT